MHFILQVDCELSPIDWSLAKCSVTCGSGVKTLKRKVSRLALYGGKDCIGNLTVTQECEMDDCPGNKILYF